MHRQAFGAPGGPTATLECPFGLVVGDRIRRNCGDFIRSTLPVFTPEMWLAGLQAATGSADSLTKAFSGQPKADHFGPINRKGEAVSTKATQGQDRCLAFSWFRAGTTSNGPASRFHELNVQ